MQKSLGLFLAALLVLGSGCGSRKLLPTQPNPPIAEIADLGKPDVASELGRKHGARTILGRTADGALYALYRPRHWNRVLVTYAHGFIAPGMPIALPTNDDIEALRDALLRDGYAVAYSSYAENGFAVADGIAQTRRLAGLFEDRLGHPRRTFLVGHSLGGLIALALAERYPGRYDGALLMSGMLGGSQAEIDYIAHVRVLFDVFYPGVLPGDLLHLPKGLVLDRDVIGPAVTAIQTNPQGAFAISQILGIPFTTPEELVGSIVQALVFQALELGDLLARTRGASFFDNSKTQYSGPLPPEVLADVNARVARHDSPAWVQRLFERAYQPSGRLQIPVLALHSTRDPAVPFFHEALYQERLKAHGRSDLFELRVEDRFGHTGFPVDRMLAAFRDLVDRAGKRDRDDDDKHRAIAVNE
jgi:alpha-beta hydrolase superfamily lysophospholipase